MYRESLCVSVPTLFLATYMMKMIVFSHSGVRIYSDDAIDLIMHTCIFLSSKMRANNIRAITLEKLRAIIGIYLYV